MPAVKCRFVQYAFRRCFAEMEFYHGLLGVRCTKWAGPGIPRKANYFQLRPRCQLANGLGSSKNDRQKNGRCL